MIEQAARAQKKIFILDRPNPLNGMTVQGPVIEKDFKSFVGLYSIAIRHGMTMGEVCTMLSAETGLGADISIIRIKGWRRKQYTNNTKLQWTMPSPNMPYFSTAFVYPGMCLLEGTNVSEGRGTTRPFELFGAPWIDPYRLAAKLTKQQILSRAGLQDLKSAYRKKAKLHHPDKGDQTNRFVKINEAHAELLNWAQNPRFSSRTALPNGWCYDASKNRWAPPA